MRKAHRHEESCLRKAPRPEGCSLRKAPRPEGCRLRKILFLRYIDVICEKK